MAGTVEENMAEQKQLQGRSAASTSPAQFGKSETPKAMIIDNRNSFTTAERSNMMAGTVEEDTLAERSQLQGWNATSTSPAQLGKSETAIAMTIDNRNSLVIAGDVEEATLAEQRQLLGWNSASTSPCQLGKSETPKGTIIGNHNNFAMAQGFPRMPGPIEEATEEQKQLQGYTTASTSSAQLGHSATATTTPKGKGDDFTMVQGSSRVVAATVEAVPIEKKRLQDPSFETNRKMILNALFSNEEEDEDEDLNTDEMLQNMEIKFGFTVEEEAWINNVLAEYTKAFESISIGEEYVKEIIMLNLDVPVSRSFTKQLTR